MVTASSLPFLFTDIHSNYLITNKGKKITVSLSEKKKNEKLNTSVLTYVQQTHHCCTTAVKSSCFAKIRTPKVQLKENVGPCTQIYELPMLMTRGRIINNKLQIFSTKVFSRQEMSINRYQICKNLPGLQGKGSCT